MEGITSNDESSLIVYDERADKFSFQSDGVASKKQIFATKKWEIYLLLVAEWLQERGVLCAHKKNTFSVF